MHDVLFRHQLLAEQPFQDAVRALVQMCSSCRAGHKAKRCCGWKVAIGGKTGAPLVFSPAEVKGHVVRPELHALVDVTRDAAGTSSQWQDKPVTATTLAVHVHDAGTDSLLARHHLDMANRDQEGPMWHIQMSGKSPTEDQVELDWLIVPRWPVLPSEIVLACEIVAFNFHHVRWVALNEDGGWVRLVQEAEDLVLTHYSDRLSKHFLRRAPDRDGSWLAAQDNRGEWDPRPGR
jgi:hypothetical protein